MPSAPAIGELIAAECGKRASKGVAGDIGLPGARLPTHHLIGDRHDLGPHRVVRLQEALQRKCTPSHQSRHIQASQSVSAMPRVILSFCACLIRCRRVHLQIKQSRCMPEDHCLPCAPRALRLLPFPPLPSQMQTSHCLSQRKPGTPLARADPSPTPPHPVTTISSSWAYCLSKTLSNVKIPCPRCAAGIVVLSTRLAGLPAWLLQDWCPGTGRYH